MTKTTASKKSSTSPVAAKKAPAPKVAAPTRKPGAPAPAKGKPAAQPELPAQSPMTATRVHEGDLSPLPEKPKAPAQTTVTAALDELDALDGAAAPVPTKPTMVENLIAEMGTAPVTPAAPQSAPAEGGKRKRGEGTPHERATRFVGWIGGNLRSLTRMGSSSDGSRFGEIVASMLAMSKELSVEFAKLPKEWAPTPVQKPAKVKPAAQEKAPKAEKWAPMQGQEGVLHASEMKASHLAAVEAVLGKLADGTARVLIGSPQGAGKVIVSRDNQRVIVRTAWLRKPE